MSHTITRARHVARAPRSLAFAAVVLAALIGCSGKTAAPDVAPGRFEGFDVTLSQPNTGHTVHLRAPTPGWTVSLDRVLPGPGQVMEAYISLQKPNPSWMLPQMLVDHQIATGIDPRLPVRVYVRTLDHGVRNTEDAGPYQLAEELPAHANRQTPGSGG
jgi:hypothetical protein